MTHAKFLKACIKETSGLAWSPPEITIPEKSNLIKTLEKSIINLKTKEQDELGFCGMPCKIRAYERCIDMIREIIEEVKGE